MYKIYYIRYITELLNSLQRTGPPWHIEAVIEAGMLECRCGKWGFTSGWKMDVVFFLIKGPSGGWKHDSELACE